MIVRGGILSGSEPKKTALAMFPNAKIKKMADYPEFAVIDKDGSVLARAGNPGNAWSKVVQNNSKEK